MTLEPKHTIKEWHTTPQHHTLRISTTEGIYFVEFFTDGKRDVIASTPTLRMAERIGQTFRHNKRWKWRRQKSAERQEV